jgi:YVTN family beta-propeller protein
MNCRKLTVVMLTAVALILAPACKRPEKTDTAVQAAKKCTMPSPSEAAAAKAGLQEDGSVILLNGRRIRPLGIQTAVSTFPLNAAVSPSGDELVVLCSGQGNMYLPDEVEGASVADQSLWFLDPVTGGINQVVLEDSLFGGVAYHPNGKYLYATGGGGQKLYVYDVSVTPHTRFRTIEMPGYPVDVVLSATGDKLYVTLQHEHTLAVYDSATMIELARLTTEAWPYRIALSADGKRAYVSNWGTTTVSVFDLVTRQTIKHVEVGKNPMALILTEGDSKLYISVSDADKIAIMDTATLEVSTEIDLRESADDPMGKSPTDMLLSPDAAWLYVLLAHENAISVIDLAQGKAIGLIPTAYYPTAVVGSPDGSRLYAINSKGVGGGPNADNEFVGEMIKGTVSLFDTPAASDLPGLTELVAQYNDNALNFYNFECDSYDHPIPTKFGARGESPIKHVVYIVRENKTYDALLGDMAGPDGDEWHDPDLAIFADYSPNLHKLAGRFTSLVNYYNEAEQSLQRHIWTAGGWINDFSEKNWISMWGRLNEAQAFVPGIEPASENDSVDIFEFLKGQGVSVRVYGEYVGAAHNLTRPNSAIFDWNFPMGFDIADSVKIKEAIREWENGVFPEFIYILLPNDHTYGVSPGKPTPEYMIADNDEATGRIVEWISNSPYWSETVVFIFEDDPQSTPDSIDAHRTICVVASPWTKRGHKSTVHFSVPSIHKTMSLILGVQPISRHSQVAAAMYDVFTNKPNLEPFVAIPSPVPYAESPDDGSEEAERSKAMRFDVPDMAPDLGKVLWKHFTGTDIPAKYADQMERDDD